MDGYTAHKACSACDYTEGKTVVPAGHTIVDVKAKAATCTVDGYNAHKACSACDYKEGYQVETATGHNYSSSVVKGTVKTYTCSKCNGTTDRVYIQLWLNDWANNGDSSGKAQLYIYVFGTGMTDQWVKLNLVTDNGDFGDFYTVELDEGWTVNNITGFCIVRFKPSVSPSWNNSNIWNRTPDGKDIKFSDYKSSVDSSKFTYYF